MKDIKDIKVTIIVAIYKSAPFLNKLMDSLFNQTHKNLEIILVDDGSPDESGKMCDEFAKQDKRVIVIHKKNGGACEARNAGMRIMTGEYFSVIDGDDWLAEDYVEYLLRLAVSNNADMSLTDNCFTTRDMEQNETEDIEIWSPEQMVLLVIRPRTMPIGPWNKLYKTDFIRKHNIWFDVPMSGETPYFLTRIAEHIKFVAKGHRRVYYYRLNNPTSALTSNAVVFGLNALGNVKLVKKISTINTPAFKHDIEWRLWHDYQWLLKLIVATNSRRKYWKTYVYCRIMMIVDLPKILRHNEYDRKQIKSIIKHVLLPDRYARKSIKVERELLAKDMEKPQE